VHACRDIIDRADPAKFARLNNFGEFGHEISAVPGDGK
jgi:hypothetical protein